VIGKAHKGTKQRDHYNMTTTKDNEKNLLVPIELLRYGIRNRCLPKVRVYLYLKYGSNGRITNFSITNVEVKNVLNIKTQITLVRHIDWLKVHHLVNYDKTKDILFLRGWGRLYSVFSFTAKTGVLIEKKDFKKFREFAFSAVVGWMVNRQKVREWKRGRKQGRSIQSFPPPFSYCGHSNIVISRELDLSVGMVSRLKQSSVKYGYLVANSKFKPLNLNADNYYYYLKSFPENYGRLRIKQRKLVLQTHDEIKPELSFKRKQLYTLKKK